MAPDGHFCQARSCQGIILIPQSTERSDPQHTRVDSSQKKLPQLPSLALILDKGRIKHLEEHIATLGWTKGISLVCQGPECVKTQAGKTGSCMWPGALDIFWRCQKPLLRCKRTFCASDAPEGFYFLHPLSQEARGVC